MDESLLPDARRPHAQDITFNLLEAGCQPPGCCVNTTCANVRPGPDIPRQVVGCDRSLPSGCHFYARAMVNVTGALCHQGDIWRAASGLAFDLLNLDGWTSPAFSLWLVHNVYTQDCQRIRLGAYLDVTNEQHDAQRTCNWNPSILTPAAMLTESHRAPMGAFTPSTIELPLFKNTTAKIFAAETEACVFRLSDYFAFPVLQLPLRFMVTSTPAIREYVKALATSVHREGTNYTVPDDDNYMLYTPLDDTAHEHLAHDAQDTNLMIGYLNKLRSASTVSQHHFVAYNALVNDAPARLDGVGFLFVFLFLFVFC